MYSCSMTKKPIAFSVHKKCFIKKHVLKIYQRIYSSETNV